MLRSVVAMCVAVGGAACGGSTPARAPRPVAEPAPALVIVGGAALLAEPAPRKSDAAPPVSLPPPVERTGDTWPRHAWDRAEAIAYNDFPMRPGIQLRAYDDHGWVPDIVARKWLSDELTRTAVALVQKTNGGVDVSKCPFPRHGVVLYDGDTPVASINVCFECGDILLWPAWEPEPDWETMSERDMTRRAGEVARQMRLYDEVFPRWQAFFRDDVGYPIDAKYGPPD